MSKKLTDYETKQRAHKLRMNKAWKNFLAAREEPGPLQLPAESCYHKYVKNHVCVACGSTCNQTED